jgi:hypothetical protein
VIVDGDRQHLLGMFLPDHPLVETLLELPRLAAPRLGLDQLAALVCEQLAADRYAPFADEHVRSGDEFAYLAPRPTAEGTTAVGGRFPGSVAHEPRISKRRTRRNYLRRAQTM